MLDRAIQAVTVFALSVWLVGASLMVMLLPPVTSFWSSRLADYQNSAVSREQLLQAADAGLRFVAGGEDTMPRGDSERTAFTPQIVQHMQDVRDVFRSARYATLAAGLMAVALALLLFRRGQGQRVGRSLGQAALFTVAGVGITALVGCLSFDKLFTWMHQLLFADGTWSFRFDSLLITAYPTAFWIAMAATWAVILCLFCLVMLMLGRWLRKRLPDRLQEAQPSS